MIPGVPRLGTLIRGGRRRRVLWMAAAFVLVLAAGGMMLVLPLSTLQGVNHRVMEYRIPAYVKAIDFIHRHYQYQVLVGRICAGKTSDTDCVMALFDWTHQNVPATPEGWPIVDDHPLHIVIRGHGTSDQMADVFTVLTGYAGVPAFFKWLENPDPNDGLVLVFARLEDKWVAFDVERHIVWRDRRGQLADVQELLDDPQLVDAQAPALKRGAPSSALVSRKMLDPLVVPDPTRAEMQQPWPRLQYELRRSVGWERE
jgi:hypothetical protein